MKQCRISIDNQVIEVFETGKYDDCEFEQIKSEVMDCDDSVEPLMWLVDGQFIAENNHQAPREPKSMTVDQLVDLLKWNGVEVWPL